MNNPQTQTLPKFQYKPGDENHAIIEAIENLESSVFQDLYKKGFELIQRIHNEYKKTPHHTIFDSNINNIVAICGERGSGKTTRLLSITNALKDIAGNKDKCIFLEPLSSNQYHALEIIDPSFFSERINILELTIGQMFNNFKRHVRDKTSNFDEVYSNKKREVVRSFQIVKKNIDLLKKENPGNDSLEALEGLSCGIELKKSIKTLVDNYLKYFSSNDNQNINNYLVIPLDDIDQNLCHGYTMIEQIRKYLMHPNVIILLATKIEQLHDIVITEYKAHFKDTSILKGNLSEMANKMILKFLPYDHQLFLPTVKDIRRRTIFIHYKSDTPINYPIYNSIPNLIYNKTHYLFFDNSYSLLPIYPLQLRGYLSLLAMLVNMDSDAKSTRASNRFVFRKYFIETWCSENLSLAEYQFIQTLDRLDEQYKIEYTYRFITGKVILKRIGYSEFINLIRKIAKGIVAENTYSDSFKFAIKNIISIIIYEAYTEFIEDLQEDNLYENSLYARFINLNYKKDILENIRNKKISEELSSMPLMDQKITLLSALINEGSSKTPVFNLFNNIINIICITVKKIRHDEDTSFASGIFKTLFGIDTLTIDCLLDLLETFCIRSIFIFERIDESQQKIKKPTEENWIPSFNNAIDEILSLQKPYGDNILDFALLAKLRIDE